MSFEKITTAVEALLDQGAQVEKQTIHGLTHLGGGAVREVKHPAELRDDEACLITTTYTDGRVRRDDVR